MSTATAALARALSIPVIASGGVGSIADIDALIAANEAEHRRRGGGPGAV